MSIQLGNNLKVFLTTNLSVEGKVLTSGFTEDNTTEIFIVSGSLSASQTKSYQYVDNHGILDSTKKLESIAKADLSTGSLNFSTSINSSSSGPFDKLLWNSLVSEATYPAGVWNIEATSETLQLARTFSTTKRLGVIVFSDDIVHVFDAVRIGSVSTFFDILDMLVNNWSCNFETSNVLTASCVAQPTRYALSGALTGFAQKLNVSNYNWAAGKLIKVGIGKQFEPISGYLASTALNLTVSNNQTYIEDNSIDRETLSQRYVDAGSMSIDGDVSFYTRSPGNYSHQLVQEINSYKNDPTYLGTYTILIEVMSTSTKKLCDIQLKSCNLLQATNDFSTVLSDKIDFKIVEGLEAQNCFIKFYT
jgi:hypothetical protein